VIGEPGAILDDGAGEVETRGPGAQVQAFLRADAGDEVSGRIAQLVVAGLRFDLERAGGAFPVFGRVAPGEVIERLDGLDADAGVQLSGEGIADIETVE